ncbi:MAG: ribonuclease III [Firmicutes bacterium]|nr:ribonuclease III [Bacillota bacterium]
MSSEKLSKNPASIGTSALAYMGDAVYEQYIREHLIGRGAEDVHKLHMEATHYVKAASQAKVIKTIFDDLSQEDQTLVKRARNKKPVTKAKNADPLDYRWATAFEALVGYRYLAGQKEELDSLIERAIDILEQSEVAR